MPVSRSIAIYCLSAVAVLGGAVPPAAAALTVIHVKNPGELQSAFRSVPDGGVIELAAGNYPAPAKAFGFSNLRKGFTVRAAAGAAVALDGQGKRTILRIRNGDRSRGKLVVFHGLVFQNGLSTVDGDGGGVSLTAAEARFEACSFLNNASTGRTTGGGAVRVFGNSAATFVGSTFRGNSSDDRGGAIAVYFSTLVVRGGELTDNRTNLPGHLPTAAGGAIYVLDSTVRISNALFARNESGWTGGAVYVYGHWTDPVTTPRSDVTVIRSTFRDNKSVPDPCCASAGSTTGGALHAEDQSALHVLASQFRDNVADLGGAIDGFRAEIDVDGSLFQGNLTPAVAGRLGAGGTIFAVSNDGAADGAVNRPSMRLTITDSLLAGVTAPLPAANVGGCLFAEGDLARMYGQGVAQLGTFADNRAHVELRRVAFVDCDVATGPGGAGSGGAVDANLIDLILADSLVIASDARGANAGGGGAALHDETAATITGTTFARDTADNAGGALFLSGSAVQVTGCRFLGNQSRGAAIYSIPWQAPATPRDATGTVSGSIFSDNAGIPLWDADPTSGPINDMRYDGNEIYPPGGFVYADTLAAPGGATVAQLNPLVVFRGGRPSTRKSSIPNGSLFVPPRLGALLAVPPALGTGTPPLPGQPPAGAVLAYAWSGGSATLAGQALTDHAGVLTVTTAGAYPLTVDGVPVATVSVAAVPCTAGPGLCPAPRQD